MNARTPHFVVAVTSTLVLSLTAAGNARAGVTINEIHYHPAGGTSLEFVELANSSSTPVSAGGWRFTEGIHYTFPEGATIPAGGFVLVCADIAVLREEFALGSEQVLGEYSGILDNGGERLVLVDAAGVLVDSVTYDDDAPWSTRADGGGASLQRICATFNGVIPDNWSRTEDALPTPGSANVHVACPPPSSPPAITINEVHYHPLDDLDELEEFVELRNNSDVSVDLRNYSFADGIEFRFTERYVVEPGGIVIVCRNLAHMQSRFGLANGVGDFVGQLSNAGERVTLVDRAGRVVDSMRYSDHGQWPVAADGLGASLEKLVSTAPGDDPASWGVSGVGELRGWQSLELTGQVTSSRFFIYLDGPGEFLIDNVVLERDDTPGVNLMPNGSFDADLAPWELRGNHGDSSWLADGGPDGSGAMRVIATGSGTGSTNGIRLSFDPPLETRGPIHHLRLDYKYVTGTTGIVVRFSGSSSRRGMFFHFGQGSTSTPGRENSSRREELPPYLEHTGRFPQEPTSADQTVITAAMRSAQPVREVTLSYRLSGQPEVQVPMADDGRQGDGAAGDGVFGVRLPAFPHSSLITYTIRAIGENGGVSHYPPPKDPTGVYGFYVNDLQPESELPVYHVVLTPELPPRTAIGRLNCRTYRTGAFAYRGELYPLIGIRRRGQSVCSARKPYLKLRFNRGRFFQGQRKLNLQSLWTDKALIREKFAWDSFRDIGMPYCREEFVRLHVNGEYWGLYGELEHPDKRFLARNGVDANGNLYKAVASREERRSNYNGPYEKKTNENGDFSDLASFLNTMHSTPRPQLVEFFQQNVDEDWMIEYQLVQTITNNSDYPHKNHYLFHDSERGVWMPLAWDMDLTFGKRWDGNFGGVLHDRMHTPGNNPWHTTTLGGGLGNHLLDKFFSQAGTYYRRAYLVRLLGVINERYRLDVLAEKIERFKELLFDEQEEDIAQWGRSPATADDRTAPAEFLPNLDRVTEHVEARREFLLNYLRTRHDFTEYDRLKITELNYNPPGPDDNEEFIELWNSTGREIDVTGWQITGGVSYTFPEGSVLAENEVILVVRDFQAFAAAYGQPARLFGPFDRRLSNAGEVIRVKDAGPDYPATIDYLRYEPDRSWPAEAGGLGFSLELTRVDSHRDNDMAANWRRSRDRGGSPGRVEGVTVESHYRRGDVDGDRAITVSDAIRILLFLFQSGTPGPCLAANDIDGSGEVRSTDAIALLRYLFRIGSATIPSPGPRDCSPINVRSCAESNCAP